MRLPVLLRPEAQADLIAARDWYDLRGEALGDRFSAAVTAVFERLATTPDLCGVIWEDVRACRAQRFPYVVYFRVLPHGVEVLAVLHGSRDPSTWRSRA